MSELVKKLKITKTQGGAWLLPYTEGNGIKLHVYDGEKTGYTGAPIDRLAEYQEAENERRIVRLKYKVGSTVYKLTGMHSFKPMKIVSVSVNINTAGSVEISYLIADADESGFYTEDLFGVYVFGSEEEATRRLASLRGEV